MYSKEQIIGEIIRIAEKLEVRPLKSRDFERNSMIPLSTVKYYLGSWKQAIVEAGLDSAAGKGDFRVKLEKGESGELLRDLIRLYEESGETPTLALIKKEGKYDEKLYTSKWKSVNDAFEVAKTRFLKKENSGEIEQEVAGKVEQNLKDFLGEDGKNEQHIDNILEPEDRGRVFVQEEAAVLSDDEKSREALDREKTEEIQKGETIIEDPIDFSAMINEIEKEESELAIMAAVVAVKGKDEENKVAEKFEEEDLDIDETDPNEITKVQTVIDIPIKKEPAKKKKDKEREREREKKVKQEPIPDDEVDFSDIGLDEVSIKPELDDKRVVKEKESVSFIEGDEKTKEIKIDVGKVIDDKGITHIPQTIQPKVSKKRRREVGEPINFRGLRHAPLNEAGVFYLFGLVSHELGFLIESIRPGFPPVEGKRCFDKENNRWEYMYIDFEYRSSQFEEKEYDESECDLVVCWIHDWEECPVEILELRSTIKYLVSDRAI
jgi:hypothetical protein